MPIWYRPKGLRNVNNNGVAAADLWYRVDSTGRVSYYHDMLKCWRPSAVFHSAKELQHLTIVQAVGQKYDKDLVMDEGL